TRDDAQCESRRKASQEFVNGFKPAGVAASFLKAGPRLHDQFNARKTALEVLLGDGSVAAGRIVQKDLAFSEPLENEHMVEIPKDDAGRYAAAEVMNIRGQTLGNHPVAARRLNDVPGITAVAGYAAFLSQRGWRHNPAVVSEDDSQRDSSA